jgi:tripartite-type tricarboxylate transporter receptor subunit TctC
MFWKAFAIICASWLSVSAPAYAVDPYPTKPITLLVPFPPGGGNDALARVVAEKMSHSLGKPVVIDNRVGGAGTIGTRFVAKSAPDGYMILLGFTGSIAINPTLMASAGIDPVKDFEPIGRISSLPIILVVNSASRFKTLGELIDYAKQNPGKLNYASSGNGTTIHIASEMLASDAGVQITHVPYRGTGLAATDLLGGHVDMFMSTIGVASGSIKSGLLRALAVANPKRLADFPDVPTLAEAGYPKVNGLSLYGLVAPAGTPRPIIDRLNKALNDALALDDVRGKLAQDAGLPEPGTPDEYGREVKADAISWGDMVRKLGLRIE